MDLDSDPDVMRFINGGRATPHEVVETTILPAFLSYYQRSPDYGFWAAIEKCSEQFWAGSGMHRIPPNFDSVDYAERSEVHSTESINVRYRAVMLHVDVGQQVFRYERLEACAAVTGSQQRQARRRISATGNSSAHCEQADCGQLLEAEVWPTLEVVLPDAAPYVRKRHAVETVLASIDPQA